jgi:hypothetical protein
MIAPAMPTSGPRRDLAEQAQGRLTGLIDVESLRCAHHNVHVVVERRRALECVFRGPPRTTYH